MRKFLTVFFVLIIASSFVFATDHNVNLGIGFHYGNGTAAKPESSFPERYLRNSAVGLQIGYNMQLDNQIVIYDNVDLGYVLKLEAKGTQKPWAETGKWEANKDKALLVQEDLGAGYAFNFDKARLVAGLGVHVEAILQEAEKDSGIKARYFGGLGANLLAEGDYEFSDNLSAFVALKPNVNLLSFWKTSKNVDCTSFAPGFSGSAVAGVSYKF